MKRNELKELIRDLVNESLRGARQAMMHKGRGNNMDELFDEDYVMPTTATKGGKQNPHVKGVDGKRLGNLFLGDKDENELKEFSMTGDSLRMVRKDLKKFINDEHKKLGNPDIRNSLEMIKDTLARMNSRDL